MSSDCQRIFNKTESVYCDCAKSEITPSNTGSHLQTCLGEGTTPDPDDQVQNAILNAIVSGAFESKVCRHSDKSDKCDKAYEPESEQSADSEKIKGVGKGK